LGPRCQIVQFGRAAIWINPAQKYGSSAMLLGCQQIAIGHGGYSCHLIIRGNFGSPVAVAGEHPNHRCDAKSAIHDDEPTNCHAVRFSTIVFNPVPLRSKWRSVSRRKSNSRGFSLLCRELLRLISATLFFLLSPFAKTRNNRHPGCRILSTPVPEISPLGVGKWLSCATAITYQIKPVEDRENKIPSHSSSLPSEKWRPASPGVKVISPNLICETPSV
jgi:hypothetical protein